jgi:hypothetical protein
MSDIRLRKISAPHPQATILNFHVLPGLKGGEDDNFLCAGCSAILIEGVSEQTMRNRLAASGPLVGKCPECGSYSSLPSKWIPAGAAFG